MNRHASSDADSIAPALLGLIEHIVGPLQHGLAGFRLTMPLYESSTEIDLQPCHASPVALFVEALAQALAGELSLLQRGVVEKQGELLATDTRGYVGSATCAAEHAADFAQHGVTDAV